MYFEGGKEANKDVHLDHPYLLRYNNKCLICLSIHTISFKCLTDNNRCGDKEFKCQCSKFKSSAAYASFTTVIQLIL